MDFFNILYIMETLGMLAFWFIAGVFILAIIIVIIVSILAYFKFYSVCDYKIVNRFITQKIAVHCQSEEEAKKFIDFCCIKCNLKWKKKYYKPLETGDLKAKMETIFYDKYKNETCYVYGEKNRILWRLYPQGIMYSNYHSYKDNGYAIMTCEEFFSETEAEKREEKEQFYNQIEDKLETENKKEKFLIMFLIIATIIITPYLPRLILIGLIFILLALVWIILKNKGED